MDNKNILIVEDEPIARDNLALTLRRNGLETFVAENGSAALEALNSRTYSLVITDLRLPDFNGIQILEHVKATQPETEVIVVTGYATVETAVEAMKKGAYHYLPKPLRLDEVSVMAEKAMEKRRMHVELAFLRQQVENANLPRIIGHSASLRQLKEQIHQIAPVDCTVLVLGETGTGKELVARSLHAGSSRSRERFLAINCASFTEELLAHELFGHEKSAFTGATSTKKGLLESANGGTFFLDEVGDMPLNMQASLLRVLEDRTFFRVGGTIEIPVDVRIIAATNRDLKALMQEGTFRQDLFYRLNVITINIPPLRERKEDVPLLANFFANQAASAFGKEIRGIDQQALDMLVAHDYPGNVRELENMLERAVVICNGPLITPAHLPFDASAMPPVTDAGHAESAPREIVSLEENERRYLAWILEKSGGSKSKAAQMLGLNRGSLWRKLKRFNLVE